MTVNSVVDDPSVPGTRLAEELSRERAGLPARLAVIGRSRRLQDEIARRSYFHPNGFVKLVLDEIPGRGQLRLHVWPEPAGDDDIHGHAWRYASVVVGGVLGEIGYAEAPTGGAPMWRHVYGQTGHRRFSIADPVAVRVAPTGEDRTLRRGDGSRREPGHVHRFYAVTGPAATMLRVGPVVAAHSHVYRVDATPPREITPRPTTRADVVEWLGVVGELAAAGAGG
ncbi:MAG TPA: hypothetical protein VFI47_09820 [Acidimicrobiales bacterium]|nr:hypothetical protein [Acidimicrobiales bacterium]